jgi:hypothetical protein
VILPRSETPIAHKDRCRFYTFDLPSQRRLPRTSRHDFVFIEPWFDAFLDQLLRYLANGWLVLAVVTQEDIKDLGLGVLHVHANACSPSFSKFLLESIRQTLLPCEANVAHPKRGFMLWAAPSEKDPDNEALEKRLWAAADQIRANSGLTSQQHSQPVLGLIFLRFAEARRHVCKQRF